jgi:uncharacterized membrane-anchored protein
VRSYGNAGEEKVGVHGAAPVDARSIVASKVPTATAGFWVAKVLSTAMGETTSDYLVTHVDPVLAVAAAALAFGLALGVQFRASTYSPWIYWLAVVMVSVFGTMVADVLHVVVGVPYAVSSAVFAAVLATVFIVWHRTERTLSIHAIDSRRREMHYWLAVVSTFALGTAVGDLTATTLRLGYFASGLVFFVAILMPGIAYRFFRINAVLAFWWAYVLTRPLGASFADWMAVPSARGGLNWGTGYVSIALAALIALTVAMIARIDRRARAAATTVRM